MSNGCGGEGGFKFILLKERVKKLDFFNPDLIDKLYQSIEERACNPHDNKFDEGGGIFSFLRANWEFIIEIMKILHWTSTPSRLLIFIVLFFGLNTIGIKYFNWTKII